MLSSRIWKRKEKKLVELVRYKKEKSLAILTVERDSRALFEDWLSQSFIS